MAMKYSRRSFLEFLGKGSVVGVTSIALAPVLKACNSTGSAEVAVYQAKIAFQGIDAFKADEVRLAEGFTQNLLVKFGDPISDSDYFGTHNDYLAFVPLNEDGSEGILWSNHEYFDPILMDTYAPFDEKTLEQVEKEQYAVGGSLVHIQLQEDGSWAVKKESEYNRRLTAKTHIPFLWDEPIAGSTEAIGTFAGCAGGVTPWGTIFSCEENTDSYYGENFYDENSGEVINHLPGNHSWEKYFEYAPEHYGWVVEVNPKTGEAQKLVAMGRCAHECATIHQLEDGRVVVYTGDDGNDRCLYKYVSDKPNDLKDGTLYVANVEKGEWVSLRYEDHAVLQEKFKNQTEVLIRMREAAYFVGGSMLNRPEDIEIDPVSGSVFISLTNNKPKGDLHGSIMKLTEDSADKTGLTFKTETFLAGSKEAGFSSPDNLAFDLKGNLWFTTDVGGYSLGTAGYEFMPCNSLFLVPRSGEKAGEIIRVATAPHESEFTGPFFHPDGKHLFLSIQHPGEASQSLDALTSNWPDGGDAVPKSGVIVISGESLSNLQAD
ncbi:MAG: secreted PhoX family phosphatase [Chitinophagales bacterium]|jgi:secreted PhoX family phosphatase